MATGHPFHAERARSHEGWRDPNHADYPTTPAKATSKAALNLYETEVKEYTIGVFVAYNRSKLRGDCLGMTISHHLDLLHSKYGRGQLEYGAKT